MAKADLIALVRKTVRDLCAEQLLGGVDGSFGYNAVAAKRDVAEQAFEAALTRIANELFDATAA